MTHAFSEMSIAKHQKVLKSLVLWLDQFLVEVVLLLVGLLNSTVEVSMSDYHKEPCRCLADYKAIGRSDPNCCACSCGWNELVGENDQLKAKVAELERENEMLQFYNGDVKALYDKFAGDRDLEQQIEALDDIRCQWLAKASEMPIGLECRSKGASCYNWAMYYAQELAHGIEQLRKGADNDTN